MKGKFQIGIILIIIVGACSNRAVNSNNNPNKISNSEDNFIFEYVYAGLGSGIGTKQPKFKILRKKYIYTIEQNSSWNGDYDERKDTICYGELKTSTIDSIQNIVNKFPDTLIYEVNSHIMSGGIHNITISNQQKKVEFRLHNSSHPTAIEIIEIINNNLKHNCEKLWLYKEIGISSTNDKVPRKIIDTLEYNEYQWSNRK